MNSEHHIILRGEKLTLRLERWLFACPTVVWVKVYVRPSFMGTKPESEGTAICAKLGGLGFAKTQIRVHPIMASQICLNRSVHGGSFSAGVWNHGVQ